MNPNAKNIISINFSFYCINNNFSNILTFALLIDGEANFLCGDWKITTTTNMRVPRGVLTYPSARIPPAVHPRMTISFWAKSYFFVT